MVARRGTTTTTTTTTTTPHKDGDKDVAKHIHGAQTTMSTTCMKQYENHCKREKN